MVTRNFWVEANIDGRNTLLAGGPRAKDGGMTIDLFIRDDGEIAKALHIVCWVCADGSLRVNAYPTMQTLTDTLPNSFSIKTNR